MKALNKIFLTVKGIIAPNLSKRDRDAIDACLNNNPNIDMREVVALYSTIYNTIQKRRAFL